jgi:hypothetical protein
MFYCNNKCIFYKTKTFKGDRMKKIYFYILVFFGFIGCAFCSLIIHEISHWQDYHRLVVDDTICIFAFPENFNIYTFWNTAGGFYNYKYNTTVTRLASKMEKIDSYTELKAYGLQILVLIIFLYALTKEINRIYKYEQRSI